MSRKCVVPDVICSCCGKKYHPRSMKQAFAKEHYCSSECQVNGQRREPDTVCPVCGKMFVSNDDHKQYCSRLCADASRKKYANKAEARKAWKQKEKERLKPYKDALKAEKAKIKAERIESERMARFHPCTVCGRPTDRKKYCSDKCAKNAENNRRGQLRRAKIRNALIDVSISLPKLYKRDGGHCWLCGRFCDWNDKSEQDGTIVCGERYPSIDHVIPLSRGGLHSWENVRLACRLCNSLKGDTYPPTFPLMG